MINEGFGYKFKYAEEREKEGVYMILWEGGEISQKILLAEEG